MREPPRRIAVAVALSLAAAALAGCLGDTGSTPMPDETEAGPANATETDEVERSSEEADAAAEATPRLVATLGDCRVLLSYSIIPRSIADEMASPAVEPRGNQAATGLFAFSKTCTLPSGDRFSELWIALAVEPPQAYPNASFVMDPVAAWTTSERMMQAYESAGLGSTVRLGEVTSDVAAGPAFTWAERIEASGGEAEATLSVAKHDPQRSDDPPGGPLYLSTADDEVVGGLNVSWPEHRGTEAWGTLQLQGEPFEAFPGAGTPAGATIQGDMHYPSTGSLTLEIAEVGPP